jgi:hypothetical protein
MLVIQPPVIFSIFTQHLIRIFALEVLATRFDLIGLEPCLQRNRAASSARILNAL